MFPDYGIKVHPDDKILHNAYCNVTVFRVIIIEIHRQTDNKCKYKFNVLQV